MKWWGISIFTPKGKREAVLKPVRLPPGIRARGRIIGYFQTKEQALIMIADRGDQLANSFHSIDRVFAVIRDEDPEQ